MATPPLEKLWLRTRLRQLDAKWFSAQFTRPSGNSLPTDHTWHGMVTREDCSGRDVTQSGPRAHAMAHNVCSLHLISKRPTIIGDKAGNELPAPCVFPLVKCHWIPRRAGGTLHFERRPDK